MKVYFIPGIGADYRIFTYIHLPPGFEPAYIHWIAPVEKEKLSDYAFRLTQQMDTTQPFIIAGMSLGGIMAVEIAKRIPPAATILISSIPVSAHLPTLYKLAGALQLSRIVPPSLLKSAAMLKHSFTMRPANRKLMREVVRAGDEQFIRWALSAVLQWDNTTIPQPLFHIHGTRDEVFPIKLTTPTHTVPKGGHNFLLSRPEALNAFLEHVLPSIQNRTIA